MRKGGLFLIGVLMTMSDFAREPSLLGYSYECAAEDGASERGAAEFGDGRVVE